MNVLAILQISKVWKHWSSILSTKSIRAVLYSNDYYFIIFKSNHTIKASFPNTYIYLIKIITHAVAVIHLKRKINASLSQNWPQKQIFAQQPKDKSSLARPSHRKIVAVLRGRLSIRYQSKYSGFKEKAKREIASLTKVMTALCTLEICEKFNMALKNTYFKVTSWAASTNGTTADLI